MQGLGISRNWSDRSREHPTKNTLKVQRANALSWYNMSGESSNGDTNISTTINKITRGGYSRIQWSFEGKKSNQPWKLWQHTENSIRHLPAKKNEIELSQKLDNLQTDNNILQSKNANYKKVTENSLKVTMMQHDEEPSFRNTKPSTRGRHTNCQTTHDRYKLYRDFKTNSFSILIIYR